MRNLEREIAKLCRKAVTEIVKGKTAKVVVTPENLEEFLGVQRFKYGLAETEDQVGVVTGLAWTEVGGDLLSIEALKLPGKGRMKTTGKLGDVMKELIDAASSWVRSKAPDLGLKPPMFETVDIHVHVPEGATPKDGPSAGIAMVTSIVSVLTGIPVRRDVAMTGEVTLRGNVLPIGGLKEKLLAALRGGITTVMIPSDNVKDLREIPDNVKNGLELIPVSNVTDVLRTALVRMPEPIDWDEAAEAAEARRRRRRPRARARARRRTEGRAGRPGEAPVCRGFCLRPAHRERGASVWPTFARWHGRACLRTARGASRCRSRDLRRTCGVLRRRPTELATLSFLLVGLAQIAGFVVLFGIVMAAAATRNDAVPGRSLRRSARSRSWR